MAKIDENLNSLIASYAIDNHGAIQKPGELTNLLNLLDEPQAILEIGYWDGGTHWVFNEMGAVVVSIDLKAEGVGIITGDSHDPETISEVAALCGTGPIFDMLFIDGEHSFASVLLDYYNYRKFVKPGGFIALHDICPTILLDMDTGKPCNVEKAWQKIKLDEKGKKILEFIEAPTNWGGIGVVYQ